MLIPGLPFSPALHLSYLSRALQIGTIIGPTSCWSNDTLALHPLVRNTANSVPLIGPTTQIGSTKH